MIRVDRIGFRGYLRFACAYDFIKNNESFFYQKHLLEKAGEMLRYFQGEILHRTFRVIRSPIGWASILAVAALAYSIILYPKQSHRVMTMLFPPVAYIRPWMLKFAIFIVGEMAIWGTGLRFIGRCRNKLLTSAWQKGEINFIYIGASRR